MVPWSRPYRRICSCGPPCHLRILGDKVLELAIILFVAVSVLGSSLFMAWRDCAPSSAENGE